MTDPKLLERLARAICRADDVDPDAEGYGLGTVMPKDERYPLWKARLRQVQAVLDELSLYHAECEHELRERVNRMQKL